MSTGAATRKVVHEPGCEKVRSPYVLDAIQIGVGAASDYDLPCVTCMPGGWATTPSVIRVTERIAVHAYRPGKMHPVGLRQPLCADCRNPYSDHPNPEG